MLDVLALLKNGRFLVGSTAPEGAPGRLPWAESVALHSLETYECTWIDVTAPTPEDLRALGEVFHFHPLALEDCTNFDQRPKFEVYPGHLFIVVHGLERAQDGEIEIVELHCFLTPDSVVTVHDRPLPALSALKQKLAQNRALFGTSTDFVLHAILDAVVDRDPRAIDSLREDVEGLDEDVLGALTPKLIEKIHEVQRDVARIRRVLLPQREVFDRILDDEEDYGISEKARIYFRNVRDHLILLIGDLDDLREALWSIRDAYFAVSAHRTNQTMKRLTVFSAIFLPLTFITGFFGMNFELIPWSNGPLFWGAMALMIVLPIALLVAFWLQRRRRGS